MACWAETHTRLLYGLGVQMWEPCVWQRRTQWMESLGDLLAGQVGGSINELRHIKNTTQSPSK